MAVIVQTTNPEGLLSKIKKGISDKSVVTWSVDTDGDFTHTPEQWKNKAWLCPVIGHNELRFGILGQKNIELTTLIYGVYHGRFIEMLLNHFDKDFSMAYATAQKSTPDSF